jgi:hypothetical protein
LKGWQPAPQRTFVGQPAIIVTVTHHESFGFNAPFFKYAGNDDEPISWWRHG